VPSICQRSLHAELGAVGERFRRIVGAERTGAAGRFARGLRTDNLILTLPFLLASDLPFDEDPARVRDMALANALGAVHFLLQDDELDRDVGATPQRAALSDRCLVLFVREYAELAGDRPVLWQHVDRYLGEYAESLSWEREALWSPSGGSCVSDEAMPTTLRRLGRKLSPLKTTCAAAALLSGALDRLPHAEDALERFHAAYQLADDLADLAVDLRRGRWTVPAWVLSLALGHGTPRALCDCDLDACLARTGAGDRILAIIDAEYDAASVSAGAGGFGALAGHLRDQRERALIGAGWRSRRSSVRAAVAGLTCASGDRRPTHSFTVGGDPFLYDPDSGLFFEADGTVAEVSAACRSESALRAVRMNLGTAADEAIAELDRLERCGGFRPDRSSSWPPELGASRLAPVTALSLHVTTGCNLSCDYCYLGHGLEPRAMAPETARLAVDLLMRESFGSDRVSLVFFGGEPLLEPQLVLETARYATKRGEDVGRLVDLHMTTNGTLLTAGVAAELHRAGVSVMVSLDGAGADHDAFRRHHDGRGSFDEIVANLGALPDGMRVGARATVTERSKPLPELVDGIVSAGCRFVHLAPVSGVAMSSGFADRLIEGYEALARSEREAVASGRRFRVGNFAEALAVLDGDAPRVVPCGAGTRYYSVRADGAIVVCHRFARDDARVVGSVATGLERDEAAGQLRSLRDVSASCGRCWARYLCGGPCLHDVLCSPGRTVGPASPWCRVVRRVLELSMWIYAGVPEERRAALLSGARTAARPELVARGAADRPRAPRGC
jgi:uncharacterized protein